MWLEVIQNLYSLQNRESQSFYQLAKQEKSIRHNRKTNKKMSKPWIEVEQKQSRALYY